MSPRNWSGCPRCKSASIRDRELAIKAARGLYGKISAEMYDEAIRKALKMSDMVAMTLREDYQVGIGSDGVFRATYRAECSRCGFEFEEQMEKNAIPEGDDCGHQDRHPVV